jgi:hypothetical protein
MTTISASPGKAPESSHLTDGFHLVADALRANDIDTIDGFVGIPITDLARTAQASRIRPHRLSAGDLGRKRGRRRRISDPAARRVPHDIRARLPQRPARAGQRDDELLPDDPDLGLKQSGDGGFAAG